MKKIVLYILLGVVTMTSCKKILEEEVFIEVASSNFYQDDDDALAAVYALYAKLRSDGPVTDEFGIRESWGF